MTPGSRCSAGRVAVAFACVLASACGPPVQEFDSGTAFTDVSVVDVATGSVAANQTVIVDGSRITAVLPSAQVSLSETVEQIDGTGRFLIPGLWDMHAHEINPGADTGLELFVANGVTGIREMWGSLATAQEVRAAIDAGSQVGPRFVMSGNIVDGANPWFPGSVVAESPERGRAVVDSLADAGAGFIKTYSVLTPETFYAIAERTAERGLYVAGHVPMAVTALEASDAGMRSMTHMFGILEGCSAAEADVRALRATLLAERDAGQMTRNPFFDAGIYTTVMEGHDEAACDALMAALVRNETWLVPTLTVLRSLATTDDPAIQQDPRLEYVPQPIKEGWQFMVSMFAGEPEESFRTRREHLDHNLSITGRAAASGVRILAGTDTPNPFVYQGFSLHDELELLVEAGLDNRAALAAATSEPAAFLQASDSLGSIAAGMLADLVLLDANPIDDIAAVRRISGVMANGRYFDRADLDGILDGIKQELAQ